MNEQIENLSKKAWLLAHEANDQAEEDEGEELTETEFNNVFQRKFAQLIVQACGDFTDPVTRNLMMKHFGVEE